MSVAASIGCLRLANSTPCSSNSSGLRLKPCSLSIRSSQADGPLRRPIAPPLREPKPTSPSPSPSPPSPKPAVTVAVEDLMAAGGVTLEYQRQMAKELQDYFKLKKLQEADQGPAFGFLSKNEINNGRWAMFGFGVGMLTEYATGSNFVDQMKILLSNFGIVDLE